MTILKVISCPYPRTVNDYHLPQPGSMVFWGFIITAEAHFKFHHALSLPLLPAAVSSFSSSLGAEFESGPRAVSCSSFKSHSALCTDFWHIFDFRACKSRKQSNPNRLIGTFPNHCWIMQNILALKELEIFTFGGKTLSYTFFHSSIGERAWNFPMSLSGTGGDPKIGSCTSNDCTD